MLSYGSWHLNRCLEICDCGGILLSRDMADEVSLCLKRHLRAFQFLAGNHGISACLFNMRPKCHYLWHTAVQTKLWRINPFLYHCFEEESWLGRVKCVAKQCHGKTMQSRVVQRYLICLALYLENFRRNRQEIQKTKQLR